MGPIYRDTSPEKQNSEKHSNIESRFTHLWKNEVLEDYSDCHFQVTWIRRWKI